MEFQDKVVVVTGASSGIGRATAELFGRHKARVIVHYNANPSGAQAAAANIEDSGGKALPVQADVSSSPGVEQLSRQVREAFGPVDVLVNNAGTLVQRCEITRMSEELFDAVTDLNFKSVFLVTRAFLGDMISRRRGAIVNVGSIAGRHGGGPGAGVYASAKAAVMCLTKAMARELAPHGIRVNGVRPGIILTPYHERYTTPELMEKLLAGIPLARGGRAEEVAECILFLASERASYLIGENIEINGGLLMD
jgi:3-oxoacyl-[acyl-carrier protein] reductase